MIGAYATRNLMFDVWLTLGFVVLGYVLKKYRFPLPSLVLAIVLGYTIETNFRRSLLTGKGPTVSLPARPRKRLFHFVLEPHAGRALVPIPKRSASPSRGSGTSAAISPG
jgi:TctA family transporter